MTFNWYKIINREDFEDSGLVSKELEVLLEGVGVVDVMVTKGRFYSLIYNGVILSLGVTEANPFIFDGYAVYLDANQDMWLGIEAT